MTKQPKTSRFQAMRDATKAAFSLKGDTPAAPAPQAKPAKSGRGLRYDAGSAADRAASASKPAKSTTKGATGAAFKAMGRGDW